MLTFDQQDTIGNISIIRPGTDNTLSGIALAFPLDDRSPQNARFLSALHVFESLKDVNLACDIILLGWSSPSSPGGAEIGKSVWEGDTTVEEAYSSIKELKEIANNIDQDHPAPEELYLSAIIEVIQEERKQNAPLEVEGSFVLVEKVQKISGGEAKEKKAHEGSPNSNKVPVVRIEGKGSEDVARKLVIEYSRYVVGLFENFD